MTENTSLQITAAEKDAYNKGWASQAKTLDGALVGAEKKYGAGDALINFFTDGYVDKNEGNPKWDSLQAKQLEAAAEATESAPTLVLVDDVVIAETRTVDLAAEAAADVEDAATIEDEQDEAAAEAPAPKVEVIPEGHVSIKAMRNSVTKDMDKATRTGIRAEVVVKKNHYRLGWKAATGDRFASHEEAQAAYLKRRPNSPYLGDWESGYAEATEGREFGFSWSDQISKGALDALQDQIED